jgi:hypothetical protein
MNLLLTIAGVAAFYFVVAGFWSRLPAPRRPALRRWLRNWMIKGFVVPSVLWVLFNSALLGCLPPLLPEVEFAKMNGHWLAGVRSVAALGIFVIGTYWTAVTSGWLLAGLSQWTEDRRRFRRLVLVWSGYLLPAAALVVVAGGWQYAGVAGTLWLLPIAHETLWLGPPEKVLPVYSRALAALNFDKPAEAEAAVLEELESFEGDFEGWMLLAELYAKNFGDLPGAENLIRETCAEPSITPSQLAVAFHRLADWQLQLAADPAGARRALEEICRRYPNSHLDKMARLRMDKLPATTQELLAPKKVRLPTLRRDLDETGPAAAPQLTRDQAQSQVRQAIERLEKDPDDFAAREDLARLYVEELEETDLGLYQVELLLSVPDPPPGKAAEWLAMTAAWQLRHQRDQAAGRQTLERLLRLYPQSRQAFSAQRRLNLMDIEAKMRTGRKGA